MALPHLFLCRHGQTDWNAEGRIQGQVDIDINDHGREQARRNGRHLKQALRARAGDFHFLASPLRRTRETMEIIRAEIGLDPLSYDTDARLVELNFGDWQGSTLSEIGARDPQSLIEREAGKWDYVPPGATAESYAVLAERARPVFDALRSQTVVVAHGGTARIFLKVFGGMDPVQAAHISIPQDRILEHRDGRADWV